MKKMMKRLSIALMMLVLVMGLTACSSKEEVEEGVSADVVTALESSCNDILETLSILTDEEIDAFLNSGDEFTVQATTTWLDNADELGTFVSIKSSEAVEEDKAYDLTSVVEFSENEATVILHFDESGVPTYLSMEVNYSLGESMKQAALNTVMGMGTVFGVLIFLIIIIGSLKYIDKLLGLFQKKPAAAPAPAAPKAAPAPVVEEELVDDKELVAVIAAAIAAYENTSTDSFVVRSIRRKPSNKWTRA